MVSNRFAYSALPAVDTGSDAPDAWPPGWDYPGPPWPPGYPEVIDYRTAVYFARLTSTETFTFDPTVTSVETVYMESSPNINSGTPLTGNAFSVSIAAGEYFPYFLAFVPEYITNLTMTDDKVDRVYLSNMPGLLTVNLTNNDLTTIDASENSLLTDLIVTGNSNLTSYSLPASIEYLSLSQTGITGAQDLSSYSNLDTLTIVGNSITSLNLSGLTNLQILSVGFGVGGGSTITSLDISTNTSLIRLIAEDMDFTTIDISNNTVLDTLWMSYTQLDDIDISSNPLLNRVQLAACGLDQTAVDHVLSELDDFGLSGGTLDLSGAGNAIPSAQGLADALALTGKGWTVTVNS